MSFGSRRVVMLLPALALAAGLASAQPAIRVTSTNQDGSTSTTTLDNNTGGPAAKVPAVGRYWDSLSSTDYYNRPPYIAAPPNPQIAVGPDDIFTVVNRTIARYPNPNAGGAGVGITVPNPYLNPPTEQVWLDVWLGVTNLAPQGGTVAGSTALCPSGNGSNATCVIDNVSIRYDQMQGRFVVVFTVTDMPAHRSNVVVVVSRYSQFTKCSSTTPAPQTCPASSPLFTPPVIAPIVGGTQTGGQNPANWILYKFPINLAYRNDNAGNSTETALGTGKVSTPNGVGTGGTSVNFLTTPFCANGGPTVNDSGLVPNTSVVARTCTNYYPTGARMGFDNDNLILTLPVLDQAFSVSEGALAFGVGQTVGPYAGTRVITVPKLMLYNGTTFATTDQPPSCTPSACLAVNLADNVYTGTLTTLGTVNPSLSSCALPNPGVDICASTLRVPNVVPPIFWEPDNLRGRALASFDAQVGSPFNFTSGVVTPFDYLVGTRISDNFGAAFVNDGSTGNRYFLQPVIFSCPGSAIFAGPPGVAFCGGTSASQTADLPVLGTLRNNTFTQLNVSDPGPVGQGFSSSQLTTNPSNFGVTGTVNSRLFVGDSRPQQVMFREGLLYVARTVRTYDTQFNAANALDTSTVLYELIKTCAAGGPTGTNGNTAPSCSGGFSAAGGNVTSAVSALSGIWTYGTNVGDPGGNPASFGFYQPMFESPADVLNSQTGGPIPPIATFYWLENVFVGMTTGGTANVAATFSKNYPSLWDFRPGDDAFDSAQPYLDPYTGGVRTTVPCSGILAGAFNVLAYVTRNSSTITVANSVGLQVGMYLTSTAVAAFPAQITSITPDGIGGATVTLSSAYTGATTGSGSPPTPPVTLFFQLSNPGVTFTITRIVDGSNQITVNSSAGLQIGQVISNATFTRNNVLIPNLNTMQVQDTTNVGAGELFAGGFTTVDNVVTVNGASQITLPGTAQAAIGESVTGPGVNAAIANLTLNPDGSLLATLNAPATAGGIVTVRLSADPLVTNGSTVSAPPAINGATLIFPAANFTSGTVPPPLGNGVPIVFGAFYDGVGTASFLPAGTSIANISGNVVTLSNAATLVNPAVNYPQCAVPNPAGGNQPATANCSGNIPASVIVGAAATLCPMIPFSSRGGAATDPNDGSLWLYGEFAKNRLSSIPGPGQWGTAVANYPLNFEVTDSYNNDNVFFQDVQPGSTFFTWIQIAKNVGLAQPALTGPCVINNGGGPIQQPPAPGTTPVPGTGQLICPYFFPDTIVTRAEMAYWVVRSQMDETMVSNYLCATGGDPTGVSICPTSGGQSAATFADTSAIVNPFIAVPTLGFPGVTSSQLIRYIEVMARRGYTKGCTGTNDSLSRYCPNDPVKRQEMAVFLIRAKMNNVFPTQLSGIPLSGVYGDNFGLFQQSPSYFSDVTQNAGDPAKDYYIYVQKMRELRITNGTSGATFSPTQSLTRKEIATFVVRAFFL